MAIPFKDRGPVWAATTVIFSALLIASPAAGPGGRPRPIAVRNLEGSNGPGATLELRNALERSNHFQIVPAPEGVPHVSGNVKSGHLLAKLESSDGRTLLKQKYDLGDPVQDVRQFADDIVLALTKQPGIATSQIAFSLNRSGTPQVFLCDFDGDNVRQMTPKGINVAPAISGDGTLLAHVSVEAGNLGKLVVTDLTSGKPKTINRIPAHGIEAVFSPDGKRLAISMSEEGGPPDLYTVKLSGFGARPGVLLETAAAETSPSWSPDGKDLVFAAATAPGLSQIYRIETGKRKPKPQPIPTGFANASEPSWSPDGRRIAFVTHDRGRSRICVHEVGAGSGARPVADGRTPKWGADSRHLIFTDGHRLSMIDTESGKAAVLIGGSGKIEGLSWTR